MIFAIIALLAVLLVLLLCYRKRLCVDTPDSLRQLAQSFRQAESGVLPLSLGVRDMPRLLQRLSFAKRRGQELYAYENWLYDNAYLVSQSLSALRSVRWHRLPCSHGTPRILALAHYIVTHCDVLNEGVIADSVGSVQQITPLSWRELSLLPLALQWAILRRLRSLCIRSVSMRRMRRRSQEWNTDWLYDDTYVYYRFLNGAPPRYKALFEKAKQSLFGTLLESEQLAKRAVGELHFAMQSMPYEYLLTLSCTLPKLNQDSLRHVSNETKLQYLQRISHLSRRLSVDEETVASCCNHLSQTLGVDVATVLFDRAAIRRFVQRGQVKLSNDTRLRQRVYMAVCIVLSLGISVIPLAWGVNAYTLVCIPLIALSALHPVELLVKRLLDGQTAPHSFCMDYTAVPEESPCVVVVSRYIDSAETFDNADRELRRLAANSPGDYMDYCMLIDFAPARQEWSTADDELLQHIKRKARERDNPCRYAVRGRVAERGGYVAWERKRGAIMQLFAYLQQGDAEPFVYMTLDRSRQYRLSVLLDDDSRIPSGGLLDAVNCMLHPANSAYDLLTFDTQISRFSLRSTYSLRFAEDGHSGGYPTRGDFYANAFDTALYCGKAIVRIESYYNKLQGRFPTRRILSHDLIEGAILRSGALHRKVYEDAPQSFLAEASRLARWQRGDVLLLPYLGRVVKDEKGNKTYNRIQPIYKFVILGNVINTVRDMFLLLTAYLGILGGIAGLWILALGIVFAPYAYTLLSHWLGLPRVRLRYIAQHSLHTLARAIERFFFTPYYAFSGLAVCLQTLFTSLAGRRNLLQWKPFFLTQRGNTFVKYAKLFVPSKLFMTALALTSFSFPFVWYAGVYVLYAYVVYSNRRCRTPRLDNRYLDEARQLALTTLGYFDRCTQNGLIMDNVQLEPQGEPCTMTSPTDLGFALLAQACGLALDDYADKRLQKIREQLQRLGRLARWHGHLYNWYNADGDVLNPVVSTVDSANFVVCVRTVRQMLLSRDQRELADMCVPLLQADFRRLFDYRRNLLYIVWHTDTDAGEGVYDTLMSEARLAYLLAIAQGVPPQAYYALSRDFCGYRGNTVLSWSGTAFEYLMPRLFVRPPRTSLVAHSESNAVSLQLRHRIDGLCGVSESSYFAFDDRMHYRYRANGLDKLAMCADVGEQVVAPYAAALLCLYRPDDGFGVLQRMTARGLLGNDGYYEAMDRGRLIRQHMAHHQGMLLAALTNVIVPDALCDWFMSDTDIADALLVLDEGQIKRIPPVGHIKKSAAPAVRERCYTYDPNEWAAAHILNSANAVGLFYSCGAQQVCLDGLVLDDALPDGARCRRQVVVRNTDGRSSRLYTDGKGQGYRFEVTAGGVSYRNTKAGLTEQIRLLPDGSGVLYALQIDNRQERDDVYEIALYQPLGLADKGGLLSHPAYQDLFVCTQPYGRGVIAWRTAPDGGTINKCMFGVQGLDNVQCNTNRLQVLGRNGVADERLFASIGGAELPAFGNVLYPCLALSGSITIPAGQSGLVYFVAQRMQDRTPESMVKQWQTWYDDRIMPYLGMVECRSAQQKLFARYADERTPTIVAAALLGGYDRHAAAALSQDKSCPLYVLPKPDDNRLALATATAVALLSLVGEYKLQLTTSQDIWEERLASIASHVVRRTGPTLPIGPIKYLRLPEISATVRPNPIVAYPLGEGGYTGDGYVVKPHDRHTRLPYSNVVCNGKVGFVATENGGGYWFGANSRQSKYTLWRNDPIQDVPSHWLLAFYCGRWYRLHADVGCVCVHGPDYTAYHTQLGGTDVVCTYRLCDDCISVTVSCSAPLDAVILLAFEPLLDWQKSNLCFVKKLSAHSLCVQHIVTDQRMQLSSPGAVPVYTCEGVASFVDGDSKPLDDNAPLQFAGLIGVLNTEPLTFYVGGSIPKDKTPYRLTVPTKVTTDAALDYQLCGLWRQLVHSRIRGRTAFYQCGGAYGYRDQLQDICALMPTEPAECRELLLMFAAHQYMEGDVQHWWHPPRTGVRTRIADDRLWLAYAVGRYLRTTGDRELLNQPVEFLQSPPLGAGEVSRYESPSRTRLHKPMREHIWLALSGALDFGRHSLLLVKGGDWNDGINAIGLQGTGESVWLSMFAYMTIDAIAPYLDEKRQHELAAAQKRLQQGIRSAFAGDRFAAYYTDDGRTLGAGSGAMALSLLPQAFAALCGAVPDDMAAVALQTARQLVDYDNGTIALFSPAFSPADKVGYIGAYPAGVRENAGQYTHAAVWFVQALVRSGQVEYAYELYRMISPVCRYRDKTAGRSYRAEPYVIAADVYTADGYWGQAGWTWYTGSAGWLYRVLTEDFFGIDVRENKLYLCPHLPTAWRTATLQWRYGQHVYRISYRPATECRLLQDGKTVADGLSLVDTKGVTDLVCQYKIG